METTSQYEAIRRHLEAGQSITSLGALRLFNCLRLSGRIHELRADGLPIETTRVVTKSGKVIASYHLNK